MLDFSPTTSRLTAPAWLSRNGIPKADGGSALPGDGIGPESMRSRVDAAIRGGAAGERGTRTDTGLEWVLVDTRETEPGAYLIRGWTDASGEARPVERRPLARHGGAIGLFTHWERCLSIGPCPSTVDDGAGLLLMGFAAMLALPLPARGAEVLGANWLLILSHRVEGFTDAEIHRLVVQIWRVCVCPDVGAVVRRIGRFE